MARPLRVIIAGAGTAGLATHLALRQAGVEVQHVERKATVQERGGNLAIWPNGGKVLESLGLGDELAGVGFAPAGFTTFDAQGEVVTRVDFGPLAERMGMPMYYTPRGHFQKLLFDAVGPEHVSMGATCTAVERRPGSVVVELADGRVLEADALIGADGVRSPIRKSVAGDVSLEHVGVTIWTGWIPLTDQLLRDVTPEPNRMIEFWGAGQRMVVVRSGPDHVGFTFIMRVPEDFDTDHPRAWLSERFREYPDRARRLFNHVIDEEIIKWPVYDVPPLPRWTDGRIALVGDAAHAASPTLGQGAGMALEDAYVLGRCLSDDQGSVAERLSRYEELRKPRAEHLSELSRSRSVASTETDPDRFAVLQQGVRSGDPHTVLNGMMGLVAEGPLS